MRRWPVRARTRSESSPAATWTGRGGEGADRRERGKRVHRGGSSVRHERRGAFLQHHAEDRRPDDLDSEPERTERRGSAAGGLRADTARKRTRSRRACRRRSRGPDRSRAARRRARRAAAPVGLELGDREPFRREPPAHHGPEQQRELRQALARVEELRREARAPARPSGGRSRRRCRWQPARRSSTTLCSGASGKRAAYASTSANAIVSARVALRAIRSRRPAAVTNGKSEVR